VKASPSAMSRLQPFTSAVSKALSLRVDFFYFSGIGSPSGLGLKEDEKLMKGKDR